MPRRRNTSILVSLMYAPWWVSVALSAVLYFIVVPIFSGNQSSPFNMVFVSFAKMFSGLLLFVALIAWLRGLKRSRLLDRQRNLDSIRSLSWRQFESLLAEYYQRSGYHVEENHTAGPDGGIDLNLYRNGERHLVQCKQYRKSKVSVSVVREMYGVLVSENATSMTIVSSGKFTQEAKKFAEGKPLRLIAGDELTQMVRSVQTSTSIPSPIAQPAPTVSTEALCPSCNSKLVIRKARRGAHAGQEFYGCSSFPNCRYTRDI